MTFSVMVTRRDGYVEDEVEHYVEVYGNGDIDKYVEVYGYGNVDVER